MNRFNYGVKLQTRCRELQIFLKFIQQTYKYQNKQSKAGNIVCVKEQESL